MAKEYKLTNGETAIFDDNVPLSRVDQILKAEGLIRDKGITAKVAEPAVEAASAIVGLPGGLQSIFSKAGETILPPLERLFGRDTISKAPELFREALRPEIPLPTPGAVRGLMEQTIPTQRADSPAGRAAQNIVRNVMMAPVRGAMLPGTLAGLTEEVVATPFLGTPLEPTARVAGSLIPAAGTAAMSMRSPAQTIAREEMARLTPEEIARARTIQQEAAAARVPVTAPEAIQRATGEVRGLPAGGATRLPELQRMIETSRGGAPIMRDFLASREAQAQREIESMFPLTSRAELGVEASQAAQAAQREAAREVSQRVGPEFRRLESIKIPEPRFNSLVAYDEVIKDVFDKVKRNPVRKKQTAGMPENSIGYIEVMRQELGDMLGEAQRAGRMSEARVLQQSYDDLKNFVDDVVQGEYQAALTSTRQAREQIQRPLESTPVARVAETTQTPQQFASLFAKNAVELNLTPDKVKTTVNAFAKQDPLLARDFVSQYIRSEFDKIPVTSQKELRKGARFSENIIGNETQRQNLLTAYEQVYGKDARVGFERMLRGLKAQAERLPAGSPTQEKAALAERGVGRAREAVSRPFVALGNIADSLLNGRDMEKFARVITSPEGVDELAKLAASPASTAQTGSAAFAIQRLMLEME
jgi:hypothetical protein